MSNTNVSTTLNTRQHEDFTVDIYQDDGVTLDTTSQMTASSSTGAVQVTLNPDNRSGTIIPVMPGSSNIQLLVPGQSVFVNATVIAAPSLKKMVVTLGPVVGQ